MKPLIVQFSGGRTSAFMARFLQLHFPEREMHFLFQNTGREHEKTLEFVLKCDREWDLRVTWIEAEVHHGIRKSSTHKIVDFESAARNGEPYEEVIKKYGIPFHLASTCTRELKIRPGIDYIKNVLGYKLKNADGVPDFEQAIGIRADEMHRINRETAKKESVIYPLVDIIKVDKKFILDFWKRQSFDLETPDNLGNCDCCFKKSINRLTQIAREDSTRFDWWAKMEKEYGHIKAKGSEDYVFFRGKRSAEDIKKLARETPTLFDDPEFETETDCFCKST